MRANCTTAPMPALVISLPEKFSSVIGNGFVRSVAKPVVFDILQEHRGGNRLKHTLERRGGGGQRDGGGHALNSCAAASRAEIYWSRSRDKWGKGCAAASSRLAVCKSVGLSLVPVTPLPP